jgi:hypothetical protein
MVPFMTMVATAERRPLLPILVALSGAHLLNDLIQSMIPAMYPLLKEAYMLDFAQIGLITLAFQVTASLLQPVLGLVTDHKPWPDAMVAGMGATLVQMRAIPDADARQHDDPHQRDHGEPEQRSLPAPHDDAGRQQRSER